LYPTELEPLTSSDLRAIILNANLDKLTATYKKQLAFAKNYPASKLAQKIDISPPNSF
jgi:dsRNA-specific ribonuclease